MRYYSTLDNLATQIVFILINKDQRDDTDDTLQERYLETFKTVGLEKPHCQCLLV